MILEVGMYVRTKKGNIGKITKITKECIFFDRVMYLGFIKTGIQTKYLYKDKIDTYVAKVSRSLLGNDKEDGVIEEGDYVNGYKVDFVQNNEVIFNHNHPRQLNILEKDIKSIVTKEQFESMSYKVGD